MKSLFRKTICATAAFGLLAGVTNAAIADVLTADVDADAVASPHGNGLDADQVAGTTVAYDLSALIRETGNSNDDVFAGANDTVTVAIARSGDWLDAGVGSPSSFVFTAYEASQSGTIRITVPAGASGTKTMSAVLTPTASNLKKIDGVTLRWTITAKATAGPTDACAGVTAPAAPTFTETGGTSGNSGWWKAAPGTTASSATAGATIAYSGAENGTYGSTAPVLGEGETTVWAKATNCGLSTIAFKTYKVDSNAPSISISGVPASFHFGLAPAVTPTCVGIDPTPGSGLTGSCTISGWNPAAAVGDHTVTGSQSDVAGNEGQNTAGYTVLAWTLKGFYHPVDMVPPSSPDTIVWNTVKSGSTVPLKFEVSAGTTELTDPAFVRPLFAKQVACVGSVEDGIEVTTTGGTSLRYDATSGQFINNWQTPRNAGSCYKVTMTTADNSSLSAYFKLK